MAGAEKKIIVKIKVVVGYKEKCNSLHFKFLDLF